jgi:hypothetical protein
LIHAVLNARTYLVCLLIHSRLSEMEEQNVKPARVVVTDFDMEFFSMVGFMVKFVIACIPAAIILAMLGVFLAVVLPAAMR